MFTLESKRESALNLDDLVDHDVFGTEAAPGNTASVLARRPGRMRLMRPLLSAAMRSQGFDLGGKTGVGMSWSTWQLT